MKNIKKISILIISLLFISLLSACSQKEIERNISLIQQAYTDTKYTDPEISDPKREEITHEGVKKVIDLSTMNLMKLEYQIKENKKNIDKTQDRLNVGLFASAALGTVALVTGVDVTFIVPINGLSPIYESLFLKDDKDLLEEQKKEYNKCNEAKNILLHRYDLGIDLNSKEAKKEIKAVRDNCKTIPNILLK